MNFQAPNPKFQRKPFAPSRTSVWTIPLGLWSLVFLWSLEDGIWSFLSFYIPNGREARERLADSRQLGGCYYLVDIFVSWACFLGEACP
jgi:hypothetical protein